MAQRRSPRSHRTSSAALPEGFIRSMQTLLPEGAAALEEALAGTPPVSIRTNPHKAGAPEGAPIPWCSTGRYLQERPIFTLAPFFHAGSYYVQEASSMFLEQALKASGLLHAPIAALDLCAAPGGKTTLLRSMLHPDALLVANEVERRRQEVLMENLWKWGMPNLIVTGSDPADLGRLPESFHLILVDAPCSGEGMFRKDHFAREQWNSGLVAQCSLLQQRIVEQAWQALRPGGILIYSTCTWEPAENEEHLERLAAWGALPVDIPLDPGWHVELSHRAGLTGHRFYPHRLQGEGFFLAMVRKPGTLVVEDVPGTATTEHPELRQWSQVGDRWHLIPGHDSLHAIDVRWKEFSIAIGNALRVVAPGRPVAESKGGAWRPHAAMALDSTLARGFFPEVQLDHAGALDFLRGRALPATAVSGPALAVYQGQALGWLNGAGNRWNNRWPAQWRIRMH